MASLGYGLGLGRFLPLTFFSFNSFCCSGYIVHLRCMSEGGSLVSVCCPAVLLSLLSGLIHRLDTRNPCTRYVYTDYVYPAFVTLLTDISCLLFLFRNFSLLLLSLFCFLSLLFHHTSFVFIFGLLATKTVYICNT